LAERTVRGVFVDRIFVARRARGAVVLRVHRACDNALDFAGSLRDVEVALDEKRLNCQSPPKRGESPKCARAASYASGSARI
jgi:hypothetical protein